MATPIEFETLRTNVPSIFTTAPSPKLSNKYVFVPTVDILEKFSAEGWDIFSAKQTGRGQYSRHEIRLRNGNVPKVVGDSLFEAVISNSHDGSNILSVKAGLFRLACSNGLTVPTSLSGTITLKHKYFDVSEVRKLTDNFAEMLPMIEGNVKEMMSRIMTDDERHEFARKAMSLRWSEERIPENLSPERLVKPNRNEDVVPNLWNTFNTLQENFVRGGITYSTGTQRRTSVRFLTDIKLINNINTGLWKMAEEYLQ